MLTRCEVYLNQGQAAANQLQGERLSAQNKGDQVTADKIAKAMLALSDAIRRAAK